MNFLKISAAFLLFSTFILGCSKSTESTEEVERPIAQKAEIPTFIITKADSFVISKVGSTFFLNYIKYDSMNSMYYPPDTFCISHPSSCSNYLRYPNYLMVYRFRIPEKPWIDELIEFVVDSVGDIIAERSPYGIPECLATPSCCIFAIDSSMAINIARKAGFEEGIKAWQANFYWFGRTQNKYVWGVTNFLSGSSGKVIIIDSNSGFVIDSLSWVTTS